MRYWRLLMLGFLAGAVVLTAESPADTTSVESKLSRLEIRRAGRRPFKARERCTSLKRSQTGSCSVERFGDLLGYAFHTNPLRILGPRWMADDDFYLLYFAYDVQGRCPTVLRSLTREILAEKLAVTVRREIRDAPVLVMKTAPGGSLTRVSTRDSCSVETPDPQDEWLPARKAGLPWGLGEAVDEDGRPHYLSRAPIEEQRMYRGCTLGELSSSLERSLYMEIADETGDPGRYDFTLDPTSFRPYAMSPEDVARQLSEQLGLDARVEKRPLEHLIVDAPPPPKRIQYRAAGPVPPAPCPAP
jgi:uncharacterized protein (TIGR03435 family)